MHVCSSVERDLKLGVGRVGVGVGLKQAGRVERRKREKSLGESGGMLPMKSLDFRVSKMLFPAF